MHQLSVNIVSSTSSKKNQPYCYSYIAISFIFFLHKAIVDGSVLVPFFKQRIAIRMSMHTRGRHRMVTETSKTADF